MRSAVLLMASALLVACGSDDPDATVDVFKSFDSLQCTAGGLTLTELNSQLASAGVQALSASCGADGLGYPAACGSPDGLIGIFEVPEGQLSAAEAVGFSALSTLPRATRIACR